MINISVPTLRLVLKSHQLLAVNTTIVFSAERLLRRIQMTIINVRCSIEEARAPPVCRY